MGTRAILDESAPEQALCLSQGDPILELVSYPEALQLALSRWFGEFDSLLFDVSGQPQVVFHLVSPVQLSRQPARAPPHSVSTGTPQAAAQSQARAPSAVRSSPMDYISDPTNPDTTRQECTRLESCLTDIHLWMSANKLKLNTDKTEVLVVGTERKLSSFNLAAISEAECHVLVSDKPISNLGVSFDRDLSMCNQVHPVVRSAYFHLRSIGLARKLLQQSS